MKETWKAALTLAAFILLSVAVTSAAARLALARPSMEHLTLETRSRLVADYSADALAMRLESLDPAVVRAAAQDESSLAAGRPASGSSTALPPAAKIEITPEATRVATPPTAVPPTPSTQRPRPGLRLLHRLCRRPRVFRRPVPGLRRTPRRLCPRLPRPRGLLRRHIPRMSRRRYRRQRHRRPQRPSPR